MAEGTSGASGDGFHARQVTRPRAQVEEQLKEAILHGTFKQGERLPPETDLAHQFGVSRPTLREALGALASAGLIRKVPGVAGGNFVNSVTPDSLRSDVERVHEHDHAARLACTSTSSTQVRRLLEVPACSVGGVEPYDGRPRRASGQSTVSAPRRSTTPTSWPTTCSSTRSSGSSSGNRLLAAFVSAVHDATHPVRFLDVTAEVAGRR